jgi:hypothetical protein
MLQTRSKASGLPHKVTEDLINDPPNIRRMAGRRALDALCGETGVGLDLSEMEYAMSSTELLEAAGVAMFGGQWKAGLGRALGVTDRTINRWLRGKVEPRPGVFFDLLKVLRERRDEITRLLAAVDAYILATGER